MSPSESTESQGSAPLETGSTGRGPARPTVPPSTTPNPASRRPMGRDKADANSFGERQAMMRLASAGFELASFSLILGGAGYGIDHTMGSETPYAAIVGLLIGFSLGFYRLIVLANRLS